MTSLDKESRSVARVTREVLGFGHGADRDRRLVARLAFGDILELRPQGTRRTKTVRLVDVYTWALKCEVNRAQLEKARARKAARDEARARARLRREVRRATVAP